MQDPGQIDINGGSAHGRFQGARYSLGAEGWVTGFGLAYASHFAPVVGRLGFEI
jgi:hypothetical protein